MNVLCPSCQRPFEAEPALSGPLGAPLCDACSKAVPAPRRRPRLPDMSFGPRDVDHPDRPRRAAQSARVPAGEVLAGKGERLSLGDIDPASIGGPGLLDGGFDALSRHGDHTSDAEPVSLLDLGRVLGPVAAPPAWSGAPSAKTAIPAATPVVRVPAPAAARVPTAAARVPAPAAARLPTAETARVPAPAPTPAIAARAPASNAARVPVEAVPSKTARPRFFDVESIPAPKVAVSMRSEPPRSSRHEDLRVLMASVTDRRPRRPDADLTSLRGALFGEAGRSPGLPTDLSLLLPTVPEDDGSGAHPPRPALAPVLDSDRVPHSRPPEAAAAAAPERARVIIEGRDPHAPASAIVDGRDPHIPRPARLPEVAELGIDIAVAPALLRYAPRSGAPGPVVSERRPTASPVAAKRGGIASWALGVASVSAVAIVLALRFGATPTTVTTEAVPPGSPRPPAVTPSPAEPPARAEAAPSSTPTAQALAAAPTTAGRREAAAPATARPVEPARTLVERAAPPVAAPPPPPVAPPAPAGGGDFSPAAARAALAAAAGAAAGCKQPTDSAGGGRVTVTFAPSGRATSAQLVSGPFQGTRTGGCIAAAFRSATVPPFAGDPVAVSKEVSIR